MTKDAFSYALQHINPPAGKTLFFYGDAHEQADLYTPYHNSALPKGGAVYHDPASIPSGYEAVLVHCPKQQEETEGLIALALSRSAHFVMAVAANDAGGNRLAKLFARYGVQAEQLSKHHCKIVWTREAQNADKAEVARSLALLTPHALTMEGRDYWAVPGLFGWNKIDPGSKLLAEHMPRNLAGSAADFGCGFGYLSCELIAANPGIVSVDAFDNDARAVEAATRNNPSKLTAIWQDMRVYEPKPVYDVIVMNPPFHTGKNEDIGLGESFIRKAWQSLRSGGQLFMVANRNLPYEMIVPQIKTIHAGQGYKIMTGRKP